VSALLTIVIAILLLWALIYVRILVHELGHVFAALLVGWKPYLLVVGVGTERALCRIGGIRIRVASKPNA
jgi:membrane-associated protease RseP (regulator of RpoE activity)